MSQAQKPFSVTLEDFDLVVKDSYEQNTKVLNPRIFFATLALCFLLYDAYHMHLLANKTFEESLPALVFFSILTAPVLLMLKFKVNSARKYKYIRSTFSEKSRYVFEVSDNGIKFHVAFLRYHDGIIPKNLISPIIEIPYEDIVYFKKKINWYKSVKGLLYEMRLFRRIYMIKLKPESKFIENFGDKIAIDEDYLIAYEKDLFNALIGFSGHRIQINY